MTHTTDQSRAQFDAWIRTHEEEHGAVDEASAWAAWTACSLMQAASSGVVQEGWTPVSERLPDFMDFCDWLMPMTDAKRERWILANESMATASVPGLATHWRKAHALPELMAAEPRQKKSNSPEFDGIKTVPQAQEKQ